MYNRREKKKKTHDDRMQYCLGMGRGRDTQTNETNKKQQISHTQQLVSTMKAVQMWHRLYERARPRMCVCECVPHSNIRRCTIRLENL